MSILIALLIFSAIVLFHEFGHFLLAKKNGIIVTEFSLGMGPRIISKQFGETRYSWKLLPLGGSCAMLGEDTDEEQKGTFHGASVWGRIAVVAAGPFFNFLLAFFLALIIVGCVGYDPAEVLSVTEGSAAEKAGLQEGDLITRYQGYRIYFGRDLYVYRYLYPVKEETITMTVEREGVSHEITYTPDLDVRYLLGFNRKNTGALEVVSLIEGLPLESAGVQEGDIITAINGVEIPDNEAYEAYLKEHPLSDEPVQITYERDGVSQEVEIIPEKVTSVVTGFHYNTASERTDHVFQVVKYSALEVHYMIRTTILSLKELLTGHLGLKELSGPVGVVDAIGTTYEATKSEGPLIVWINMLNMALMLSADLGIMNLLPIPALDGGRLVFLFLEAIRRKPINRNVEGSIHFAGLMLLMALMVVVMYNDILKIF